MHLPKRPARYIAYARWKTSFLKYPMHWENWSALSGLQESLRIHSTPNSPLMNFSFSWKRGERILSLQRRPLTKTERENVGPTMFSPWLLLSPTSQSRSIELWKTESGFWWRIEERPPGYILSEPRAKFWRLAQWTAKVKLVQSSWSQIRRT